MCRVMKPKLRGALATQSCGGAQTQAPPFRAGVTDAVQIRVYYKVIPVVKCTHCGRPLETNARFCRNCGQPTPAIAPGSSDPDPAQLNRQGTLQEQGSRGTPTSAMESWQEPPAQPTVYPQLRTPPYPSTQ